MKRWVFTIGVFSQLQFIFFHWCIIFSIFQFLDIFMQFLFSNMSKFQENFAHLNAIEPDIHK